MTVGKSDPIEMEPTEKTGDEPWVKQWKASGVDANAMDVCEFFLNGDLLDADIYATGEGNNLSSNFGTLTFVNTVEGSDVYLKLMDDGTYDCWGTTPVVEIEYTASIDGGESTIEFEEVEKDTDRDNYMTAEEAKEYGLIDEVIAPKR